MVVIFLPAMADTGITQERIGCPSTCTVQAPHIAIPQPYLVPVSPSSSRNAHNSGISSSTSTFTSFPLTFRVVTMCSLNEFVRKYFAKDLRTDDGSKDVCRGCDKKVQWKDRTQDVGLRTQRRIKASVVAQGKNIRVYAKA